MDAKLQIFNYNGSAISFNRGESVMVNATEMAKPFGKRPVDWLNLPSTKEFIEQLSIVRKSNNCDFQAFMTVRGSSENGGGTWMHEDVAIEFARWLAPPFAIWMNDRIKELFTKGSVSLMSDDEKILSVINLLQERVDKVRDENRLLSAANAEQEKKIEEMKPIVEVAQCFVESDTSICLGDFAKVLNSHGYETGRNRLFKWMRDNGYLMEDNRPYQDYVKYFDVHESVNRVTKKIDVVSWITPKGQQYFFRKLILGVQEPTLF